ncbi:tetratricopeptide repeat protein [Lysobacter changpingensis]|uniref:tetratricopeptide repeat protein n=1 Tax=Lysobacter changpingensis TaxID=2792784 RepID=UPI001A8DAA7C|nr:hypothetical protein [Lysobacter changpingensis]
MKIRYAAAAAVAVFIAGAGAGYTAQKAQRTAPDMYHARQNQDAAKALLAAARIQAGKGSWEQIAVGRVYYLGGFKAEGQAIFDAILNGKHEDSDVFRIARVYSEAGEWSRAQPLFQQYFKTTDDDGTGLAEVGALYLLNGDRQTAEQMFDRSVAIEPEDLWATLHMAGAYLDVKPQE